MLNKTVRVKTTGPSAWAGKTGVVQRKEPDWGADARKYDWEVKMESGAVVPFFETELEELVL
jgi:hypothetical protein